LGLAGLALFAVLYVYRTDWYFRIAAFFFVNPFRYPFLDLEFIPAAIDCWRHGVDVYVGTPCDVLNRPLIYSPLWLRATFLATGRGWTNWIGVTLDGLFLLSLGLLPQPRRPRELGLVIFATFSSLVVFALERGNFDLIMFLLAVVVGLSLEHSLPRRIVGYAAIMIAGLLKFYPFVLLLLLLRERLARFVAFALVAVAVMGWFVWQFHGELVRAVANLPPVDYFGDSFGAQQLPGGLPVVLAAFWNAFGLDGDALRQVLQNPAIVAVERIALGVGAIVLGARLAVAVGFRAAITALPDRELIFLMIGAALIAGCFFAGENVGYRGIHLLFALPGLLALVRAPLDGGTRTLFCWTIGALVFNLWYPTVQHLIEYADRAAPTAKWTALPGRADWIIHEAAWWWLVTVFLAVLIRFALDSTVWLTISGAVRGGPTEVPPDPAGAGRGTSLQ